MTYHELVTFQLTEMEGFYPLVAATFDFIVYLSIPKTVVTIEVFIYLSLTGVKNCYILTKKHFDHILSDIRQSYVNNIFASEAQLVRVGVTVLIIIDIRLNTMHVQNITNRRHVLL